jgi:hypothetical protein
MPHSNASSGSRSALPIGVFQLSALGFAAASMDPMFAIDGINAFASKVTGARIPSVSGATVTSIAMSNQAPAVYTDVRMGLWGLDGNLIARTANLAAAWATAGLKEATLTAEPGKTLVLPGTDVFAGVIPFGADSRIASSSPNTPEIVSRGLSTPFRAFQTGALGALPTTLPAVGGAIGQIPWVALI